MQVSLRQYSEATACRLPFLEKAALKKMEICRKTPVLESYCSKVAV